MNRLLILLLVVSSFHSQEVSSKSLKRTNDGASNGQSQGSGSAGLQSQGEVEDTSGFEGQNQIDFQRQGQVGGLGGFQSQRNGDGSSGFRTQSQLNSGSSQSQGQVNGSSGFQSESQGTSSGFQSQTEVGSSGFQGQSQDGSNRFRSQTEGSSGFQSQTEVGSNGVQSQSQGGSGSFQSQSQGGSGGFQSQTEVGSKGFQSQTETGSSGFQSQSQMDGSSGFQSQSKDGSAGFQWMGGSSGFQSQGQVDGSNGFQWSQWGGFGGFQKQLNGSSIKRKEGSSSSFQGQGKDLHSAQGHDKDKIFQYQADDSNVVQNEMDGSSRNENGSRRRRDLSQAEIIHQFTQQMDTISSQNVQLEHQVTQLQAENAVLQSTHCSRRKRAPSQAKLIRTVQSQGKDLQSFQVHGKDKAYHNFQLEAGGTDVFQNQADDFSNKGKKENRPKRELSQAEIIHEFTQQLNTLSSQTVQLEHQVNQLQAENDALKARHCPGNTNSVPNYNRPTPPDKSQFNHNGQYGALWRDCSPSGGSWITVTHFDVTPFPMRMSSTGYLTLHSSVTHDLTHNIVVEVSLLKHLLGVWVRVPCMDNFGSCRYDDFCYFLQRIFSTGNCPREVRASNNVPIDLSQIAQDIPGLNVGDFYMHVLLYEKGTSNVRGCFETYVSLAP